MKITTPRKSIATIVSASALPRFATNPPTCACPFATCTPVISAAIPPDALQSASAIAMTSVTDTPARFAFVMDVSWKTRKSWTSLGSAEAMSCTCRVTSSGFATSP